jgi:hypothetical protein
MSERAQDAGDGGIRSQNTKSNGYNYGQEKNDGHQERNHGESFYL